METFRKQKVTFISILVVAFLIRVIHLNAGLSQEDEIQDVSNVLYNIGVHPSFWIKPDRYAHIFYHGPFHAFVIGVISNVVLFPFLLYYQAPFPLDADILRWEKSTGIYLIEAGFRFVSVLYALGTIFFVYKLGRKLHENVGLVSALVLSVSSWHIYFSCMIAPYSGIMFFMTAAVYFFITGLERYRKELVYLSAVLLGLTVYMNVISAIIPLFLFTYVLLSKKYRISEKIFLNSAKIYSGVGLSLYLLMLVIWGPQWLVEQILVKRDIIIDILYQAKWFPLWDPVHGVTDSINEPFIYLSIFKDYLSSVAIFFVIIGILASYKQVIKNRNENHLLFLCWFFVSLICLQVLNARTPRFPALVLPVIALFSGIGISELKVFFSRWSNFFVCLSVLFVIVSEPFLFRFLSDDYMIITEDLGAVYDFRSVADYINKGTSPTDIIYLGVRRTFPWWYLKGNTTSSEDRVVPYDYGEIPKRLRYSGFSEPNAKYIVLEQLSVEACGSGGGPVWLKADYGKGQIILVSAELDYPQLGGGGNNTLTLYSNAYSSGKRFNLENLKDDLDSKDEVILIQLNDDDVKHPEKLKNIFEEFISNGGTVVVFDPKTRYINWLPLEAKVATQVGFCDRTQTTLKDRIYFLDNRSEDVHWSGFYFDYDPKYNEVAFNSPVGVFIHKNYDLDKLVRTHELNWPLVWVYKKKQMK